MDAAIRCKILGELKEAFGNAVDVSPSSEQPPHVLLANPPFPAPWHPARALVRFQSWPDQRPDFFIDPTVVNGEGQPPRSSSEQYAAGERWLQFSYSFPWTPGRSATAAVLAWLRRFEEAT